MTHAECARRLTIYPAEIRRLIRLPDGDPRHLPGVLITARGGTGWRVHPEVFAYYLCRQCSPTPPPMDAMSTEELIEFLAGERISSRTGLYRWWQRRLDDAVAAGVLTEYLVMGRSRWSPAEAAGVKDALDGIKGGGRNRADAARCALAAMRQLVDVAETMRITGAKRRTVESWSGQGGGAVRFGARMIGGRLFFKREQLKRVTTPGKAILRKCASCGKDRHKDGTELKRTPSHLHESTYCDACWEEVKPTAQVLRDGLARIEQHDPEGLYRRRSEAQQRSWREGKRDMSDYLVLGDAEHIVKLHNSENTTITRINRSMMSRFGRELTAEREREIRRNVRSRARKGKAGRKRDEGQREILLGILREVLAELAAGVSESEVLASVGLRAWQRDIGDLRADIPATTVAGVDNRLVDDRLGPDDEAFDPRWRRVVIDRIRRHIGADVKSLQIAGT